MVLTYKSILEAVNDLVATGRLFEFPLEADSQGERRYMYTSYEIHSNLCSRDLRWVKVEAVLAQFVEGRMITLRREGRTRYPDRDLPADIVHLEAGAGDPPEIWEIRSVESDPQIRLLGSFGVYNRFIALTCHDRPRLDSHAAWRAAMLDCGQLWNEMFFPCDPHKGRYPDGYLSTTQFVD